MGWFGTDLRDAVRGLRAAPRFTIAAVVLLAAAIGATSTAFGLVDAALVRALPFRASDRLVWVWATRTDRDKAFFSIPNFMDTRERCSGFEGLAAFANWGVNLGGVGDPERIQGIRITPDAFALLGVSAAVGRTLTADDARPETGRVVVLGHGLWQRSFGGDPGVIGRTILLNDDAYTVVGVLPPDFFFVGADAELAVPLLFDSAPRRTERGSNFLRVYGRLKPGVSLAEISRELAIATRYLRDAFPDDDAKLTDPRVLLLRDEIVGGNRVTLLVIFGASAIVLLVACANLSGLALVRAAERRRDIAVRVALGARPARIVRLLILESTFVALAGSAGGLAIAWLGIPAIAASGFVDLPLLGAIGLDARAAAFTIALTAAVAVLIGLLPARVALRFDLSDVLHSGGRTGSIGRGIARARNALVAVEIAATLVLLVCAGLLAKSLLRLGEVRPGFDPENVLTVRLSLPPVAYTTPEAIATYADRVVDTIEHYPGVRAAGLASVLPMSGMNARTDFRIAGRDAASRAEIPGAQNRVVTPGYFQTMDIPIRSGRGFDDHDRGDTAGVVVVDEALARRFFPDADPVGAHLFLEDTAAGPREVEVVGVVGDVKHFSLDEESLPTIYAPVAQTPAASLSFLVGNISVVARTGVAPSSVADGFVRAVRGVDPSVPVATATTIDQMLSRSLGPRRMTAQLVVGFAPVALAIAVIGLYAVVAYAVSRRSRELAIRLALGATGRRVVGAVLRPVLGLAAMGVIGGFAAALALMHLTESLLFEVSPYDPWIFVVATAITATVATLAALVPARRAQRVDPALMMRAE
jgi:putative ABC transport system permease protein